MRRLISAGFRCEQGIPFSLNEDRMHRAMKFVALFSPSPVSYYRLREFTGLQTARDWCQSFAAIPSQQVYVKLIEVQDLPTLLGSGSANQEHRKYIVLWKDMEPCYHSMREFDQFQDAAEYASLTKSRMQELHASPGHHLGLPDTIRVVAATTLGEWNLPNKPR